MNTIRIEIPRQINDRSRGEVADIWKALKKFENSLNEALRELDKQAMIDRGAVSATVDNIDELGDRIKELEEKVKELGNA